MRIPYPKAALLLMGTSLRTRRRINGDENLPSEGVLFSLVNEDPMNILKLIVMENPSALNLDQAPLGVGESFTDPSRNLTVDVLSQTGNNYTVRIRVPAASVRLELGSHDPSPGERLPMRPSRYLDRQREKRLRHPYRLHRRRGKPHGQRG
ncbi:MAG: hypothetical protein MZV70_00780 [Desulfobacterales bacterium]|nr:hypothetical protein [Desulfobacterales bacterium]